jgi:hypothetical protein
MQLITMLAFDLDLLSLPRLTSPRDATRTSSSRYCLALAFSSRKVIADRWMAFEAAPLWPGIVNQIQFGQRRSYENTTPILILY